jgi:hypothetical protein
MPVGFLGLLEFRRRVAMTAAVAAIFGIFAAFWLSYFI